MATFIKAPFCNMQTNGYPDKGAILSYAAKPNCEGCLCRKKDAVGRGTGRGPAVHLLCKEKTLFFSGEKGSFQKRKGSKQKKMPSFLCYSKMIKVGHNFFWGSLLNVLFTINCC